MRSIRFLALPAGALIFMLCGSALGQEDAAITRAVESELQQDQAVPFNQIDVSTENGLVTLSGSVPHLLASDRAAMIAATVKGVRVVDNNLAIDPGDDYSDESIETRVRSSLQRNPATDAYEIGIEVNNGIVTLDGKVESFQESELAEKVALGVRGVKGLVNEIAVVYEGERPDGEIGADIRQGLRMDALVDHERIEVEVNDSKVTLSGTVGSLAEKDFAIADAWVLGVKEVRSASLAVEPSTERELLRGKKYEGVTDKDIAEGIRSALILNPAVEARNVAVSVENGTVTLQGTVDTLHAKRQAADEARLTVGVSRVRNNLKVRFDRAVADEVIEEQIREALAEDPWVEKYEITVDAIYGTVFLSGTVDSYFEKSRAGIRSAAVAGVEKVDNNLAVGAENDLLAYDPYLKEDYYYDYGWYRVDPTLIFRSDSEIKEQINDQLFWSPFVDADEVEVSVEDGMATLRGTVDSWAERNAAYENALEGGAVWVRDQMTVD